MAPRSRRVTDVLATLSKPRRATLEDASALQELDAACFRRPWTATHWRAELTSARSSVEIVEDTGGVLVLARVCLWVLDEGSLLRISTHPAWRGRGLARAAMGRIAEEARERGARTIDLEVAARNAEATALYVACGYVEVGRRSRYYDDGDDAILMRRIL
jgi:ribosomal protein S18 acetylase RimI-like enzyme